MEWFHKVFSGAVDASRVNPAGLILMLLGVAIAALAGRIAHRFKPDSQQGARNAVKVLGLLICAGGALAAIMG